MEEPLKMIDNNYQDEKIAVYKRAQQLEHAGYKITCAFNYRKFCNLPNWPNIEHTPKKEMTGVCIVSSKPIGETDRYFITIDIDIFAPEKKKAVFDAIMSQLDNVYTEITASGGYHIVFLSNSFLNNKKIISFQQQNDNAKYADQVEIFLSNKSQIMTAPSIAVNKKGKISQYHRISEIDLTDTTKLKVMNFDEISDLIMFIEELSSEYRNQIYSHRIQIKPDQRAEIRTLYHKLKSKGYVCAPLYNGDKHSIIINYDQVKDTDFDSNLLTGIRIKLGPQKDDTWLCALDFDNVSEKIEHELEREIEKHPGVYMEKSVSGGYHIIFKTEKNPDIEGKRHFPSNHGQVELLYTKNQAVNIAPTCSYVRSYEFSDNPVYNTSQVLSSDIFNMEFIPVENVRVFMNRFETNNLSDHRISQKEKEVLKRIYDYGSSSEINQSIKKIFPDPQNLLKFLKIRYLNCPDKNYTRFRSLVQDDGRNPDAVLYNNSENEKWSGYSVQDFHYMGITLSFANYLCMFDINRFQRLMDDIGFGDVKINCPIETEYLGEPITITCQSFPSPENVLNHINKLINQKKQPRIIITAPTGVGKTTMFYHLAKEQKLKIILALSYTSQVHQGKSKFEIPGVLGGMCENDKDIPEGSIFMTYDKSRKILQEVDPEDYILVIDEAHNLVNHSEFRQDVLNNLKSLADKCKMVIYMTATPEYLNFKNVDMVIEIQPEKRALQKAIIFKYEKDSAAKLSDLLIKQRKHNTIDVVYSRSIKTLGKIEAIIKYKFKTIETHQLNAQLKSTSKVYQNISKHEQLAKNNIFKNGGILFTTNLIVDGVNILDSNIGNVFLLDIYSTTDLIQYPSRFRKGYQNYYILISGNKPDYFVKHKSRNQLLNQYYKLSTKYKKSYDHIKNIFNISSVKESINLIECYEYLDKTGNIMEEMILLKIQEIEASKMRWDVSSIEYYMENQSYFKVYEYDRIQTSEALTKNDIISGKMHYKNKIKKLSEKVKLLLKNDEEDLLKDYLKKNQKTFKPLVDQLNINNHVITNKYDNLMHNKDCTKILWKYCRGIDIGLKDPMLLVDNFKVEHINSIRRTLHNLKLESSGLSIEKNDKYFRFHHLRLWISSLKNHNDTVKIDTKDLHNFIISFNQKYGKVYKLFEKRNIVKDLNDIFDVEVIRKGNERYYIVKNEWSIDNIHGINFTKDIIL
jgi:hypothetical protein